MQKFFIVAILIFCYACANRKTDSGDSYNLFETYNDQEKYFVKKLPPVLVKSILKRNREVDIWLLNFLDKTKHIRVLKSLNTVSKSEVKSTSKDFKRFCKKEHYKSVFAHTDEIGNIVGFYKNTSSSDGELLVVVTENQEVFVMSLRGQFDYEELISLESEVKVKFFRSIIDQFF